MRSFAIVIRRAYFEAKKRRIYAENVVVNRSVDAENLNAEISVVLKILRVTKSPKYVGMIENYLCIHRVHL